MTAPLVSDPVRAALLAVVGLHAVRETYEPPDAAPMTICGECGHQVDDDTCPTLVLIAEQLGADLDGIPPGHEAAAIHLHLDVMSL